MVVPSGPFRWRSRRCVGLAARCSALAAIVVAAWMPTRAQTTTGQTRPRPAAAASPATLSAADARETVTRYCVTCHNDRLKTGDLSLEGIDPGDVGAHPDIWEKAVRKVRVGMMPP